MTAITAHPDTDLTAYCDQLADAALAASRSLAPSSGQQRNQALRAIASSIRASKDALQAANAKDLEAGRANNLSPAMLDRLELTPERIEDMANGIEAIARLKDPIGEETARWTVPSGLDIARVRTFLLCNQPVNLAQSSVKYFAVLVILIDDLFDNIVDPPLQRSIGEVRSVGQMRQFVDHRPSGMGAVDEKPGFHQRELCQRYL